MRLELRYSNTSIQFFKKFMTQQEQITNWLTFAFTPSKSSESFYFDSKDNQFFSVMLLDYMMINEKFELDEKTTVTCSPETIKTLLDRMKRIDNKDASIVLIPSPQSEVSILNQIDSFIRLPSVFFLIGGRASYLISAKRRWKVSGILTE